MAEKTEFQKGDFREFKSAVTLNLTLDDLESYIVRFVSSISIRIAIDHIASLNVIVNGRMGHLC